jgi:DNA-binding transcriptional LysR family regulator
MALDPRHLKAFLAITECGSLGLAAESLHVTQPALSRTIRRLESQLGVPLFERRPTGMELTMFGRALFPHASLLTTENALAVEQINALRGLGQGTIRIGAVASAAIMLLPAVLNNLLETWPQLQVQITEGVEDVLETALTNNVVDVVIGGPIKESEHIVQVAEHGFTDRYSVLSAVHHPLQDRGELAVQDIAGQPWVMPPPDAVPRRQFNELTSRLGIAPPHVAVETRSPSFIKAMVAKSLCLGWLPEPLFAAEQAAGRLKSLRVPQLAMQRCFFVFRRRRNYTPPPVVRFLEALRNVPV